MSDVPALRWKAPGPVAQGFLDDWRRVTCILGPIGSAKTTTSFQKMLLCTLRQAPGDDGVRHTKFAVLRDTYRELWKTTIPSWHKRFPKSIGHWVGAEGQPAVHEITLEIRGFGRCHMIVEFVALGDHGIEDMTRGWEMTAVYLNECDRLPADVLTHVRGRVGRYPSGPLGRCTWKGVWCDMNAPDVDNWTYDKFVENKPEGFGFHRQPGGRSPKAENLENLPEGYYEDLIEGQPAWWVRRMIDAEFGYSREGMPVFEREFSDSAHVAAADLVPTPGLPLQLGGDAGRTPAVVVLQPQADGRWLVLEEILASNMGALEFGPLVAKVLRERYAGFKIKGAWGDPSAAFKHDTDEATWLAVMTKGTGTTWRPAPVPGNNLTIRLDCVRQVLSRNVGGKPYLLISPRCRVLRKGFNSGYCYRRLLVSGDARYAEAPEKNGFSHVHDALQYGLAGGGEAMEVLGRNRDRSRAAQPVVAGHSFNVYRS